MDYYQDSWGTYRFIGNGRELNVYDLIARGIDVVGAWSSRSPYVSPNDPRFQQQQRGNYGAGYPNPSPVGNQTFVPGSINPSGFQINWQTALIGGLLIGAFFLGSKRR